MSTPPLKPPVLVIGTYRSGTTMMLELFDRHPEVCEWFEPRTVWQYADPGRPHDRFDAADATPRVIRYIRKRFLQRQRSTGGRRVSEKTPTNVLRIPYVHAVFPECKLLYIVRHPLSNLSSGELMWRSRGPTTFRRAWQRFLEAPKTQVPGYAVRYLADRVRRKLTGKRYRKIWGLRYPGIHEDRRWMSDEQIIASQWAHAARQAEADLAEIDARCPGLVMRLRYEDFVADPVNHFQRVLEHFGLSMSDDMAREVRHRVDPGRTQKWKRLDPAVLAACLPILEPQMRVLGYEMPSDLAQD